MFYHDINDEIEISTDVRYLIFYFIYISQRNKKNRVFLLVQDRKRKENKKIDQTINAKTNQRKQQKLKETQLISSTIC
jgi:hypothetical protein